MSFPTEASGRLLRVATIGMHALRLLEQSTGGSVAAVFEHSLYVRLASGAWICIGARSIGAGPLNVLLSHRDWRPLSTSTPGISVRASGDALAIGQHRLAVEHARSWRPRRAYRGDFTCARLHTLVEIAHASAPHHGLSRLAWPGANRDDADPLLTCARPGWQALEHWLAASIAEPAPASDPDPAASMLIGLGPGLTPSGDDLFCGVLIALRSVGCERAGDALWSWLEPQLETRTSALSAAHVRAAAAGQGHSALHAVLDCFDDDRSSLDRALRRLGRIGHCSGWDALAGVVSVWRAFAAQAATSRAANSAA